MVWAPAQEEDACDQDGHTDSFLPLQALGLTQCPDDGCVAVTHDQQRHKEAHGVVEEAGCQPRIVSINPNLWKIANAAVAVICPDFHEDEIR